MFGILIEEYAGAAEVCSHRLLHIKHIGGVISNSLLLPDQRCMALVLAESCPQFPSTARAKCVRTKIIFGASKGPVV